MQEIETLSEGKKKKKEEKKEVREWKRKTPKRDSHILLPDRTRVASQS